MTSQISKVVAFPVSVSRRAPSSKRPRCSRSRSASILRWSSSRIRSRTAATTRCARSPPGARNHPRRAVEERLIRAGPAVERRPSPSLAASAAGRVSGHDGERTSAGMIVATAGQVDMARQHLVKALTGIEPTGSPRRSGAACRSIWASRTPTSATCADLVRRRPGADRFIRNMAAWRRRGRHRAARRRRETADVSADARARRESSTDSACRAHRRADQGDRRRRAHRCGAPARSRRCSRRLASKVRRSSRSRHGRDRPRLPARRAPDTRPAMRVCPDVHGRFRFAVDRHFTLAGAARSSPGRSSPAPSRSAPRRRCRRTARVFACGALKCTAALSTLLARANAAR